MADVSIVRCGRYDLDEVSRALREALEPLGTLSAFVRNGQKVLLKPNLLIPVSPDRAVTTHPVVVEAVIGLVREAGGDPFLSDSPSGPLHKLSLMNTLYKKTGLYDVAQRTGVPIRLEDEAVSVSPPEGGLLKRLDLLKAWKEADVVISLPKLKTHNLTYISGAVKNLFGLVPGLMKPAYHAKLYDVHRFCDMLLDVAVAVRPALSIMDGILAMEGNGPSTGGTPRRLGLLLVGSDPVALDAVMCRVVGADPDRLPLFKAARRRGLWPIDLSLFGVPPEEAEVSDFRFPDSKKWAQSAPSRRRMYRLLMNMLSPRPVPRLGRCTSCGDCVRMCPVRAVSIDDRSAVVDDKRCIRCYCCHEICPEAAIDLVFSPTGRFLRRIGWL